MSPEVSVSLLCSGRLCACWWVARCGWPVGGWPVVGGLVGVLVGLLFEICIVDANIFIVRFLVLCSACVSGVVYACPVCWGGCVVTLL